MSSVLEKQHAHELIERLEATQVTTVIRFLEFMMLDPVSRSLATAAIDDEPLTEEEVEALSTSKEWFKHHPGIPHDEILAEFGLKPDDDPRQ
jgi:hypothetical protein